MLLYVVVHHEKDDSQPWRNAWVNSDLIEAIQTTNEIGTLCIEAKAKNQRVYVHRCGWRDCAAVICCSAEVEDVTPIDDDAGAIHECYSHASGAAKETGQRSELLRGVSEVKRG